MFNNKHKCPDPLKDYAPCAECRCLVRRNEAQCVVVNGYEELLYCLSHKKPYQEMTRNGWEESFSTTYYAKIQVTKDGTPVGYKKM